MCFGRMANEVFRNSVEQLCRKNCERVLIIIYCLCKNVFRMCRKEANPLTELSPFCTSNQTGWKKDACLMFFLSLCFQSNKSGHYDRWTTVVNHQVAHHLPGTTPVPVLHLWAAHWLTDWLTDWLRSTCSGSLMWSHRMKARSQFVLRCVELQWERMGFEPLVYLLLCEIWSVCTWNMIT